MTANVQSIVLALGASYLLGSVPTAYLFGKVIKKIDIRQHGSGNVGATNAFRVLGPLWGSLVLIIDILKGIVGVTLVGNFLKIDNVSGRIGLALAAVCGHNWTIFLNFQGGKGIATSLGVLIGLAIQYASLRLVLGTTVLGWIVCFLVSRYVSLSSLLAALLLPALMLLTAQPFEFRVLAGLFCVFIFVRHKSNISRLLAGKERRVSLPFFKKPHS